MAVSLTSFKYLLCDIMSYGYLLWNTTVMLVNMLNGPVLCHFEFGLL